MDETLRGIGAGCIACGLIKCATGWLILLSTSAPVFSLQQLEASMANGIGLLLIAVGVVCRKLAQKQ